MDPDALRVFVKVAELASFSRAAEHLGLSRARASIRIQELEASLGCLLLHRTTRAVRLTPDGEQLLPRARRLVAELDELSTLFQGPSGLRGCLRIDLPIDFACNLLLPRLPEFLAAHPQLEIQVSTTDRRVDLVREGFDCVLRIGALEDSGLVARRLGSLLMVNCASPAYLLRFGVPRSPDELDRHQIVDYSLRFGSAPATFEYRHGDGYRERPVRSSVTVNSAGAYLAACLAGLGIIQAPRVGMRESLASGALVEVLHEFPCAPMPVAIVHNHGRNPPRRVRAVVDWIARLMAPHLEAG
ncbi:MAG: LysR family transcriptional regulator [Polyangiaceae bacterium]|jgi:DNA-binding transcriptional LysR family regulator|nr:LysR family transcriptional regulator [Polyangiaceae bacterium]